MKTQKKTSARPDFLRGVVSGLWPDGRGTASTLHFLQKSRMIEVGTMRVREAVCTGEKSDARANGFSPRLFGFVGKTSKRGRPVRVGVQASACLNEQAKA
jgi:hypothetical protein